MPMTTVPAPTAMAEIVWHTSDMTANASNPPSATGIRASSTDSLLRNERVMNTTMTRMAMFSVSIMSCLICRALYAATAGAPK